VNRGDEVGLRPLVFSVLLVEDDPGDALLVEELLSESDAEFRITYARSVAEAVDAIVPGTDCVLLDLGLPDSEGLDGLRTLLELRPAVAIVVLTGFDDRTSGARAVTLGAQDYLVKGAVDGVTLARSLRYAIARREGEQMARRLRESEIYRAENSRLERGLLARPLIFNPKLAWSTRYRAGGSRTLLGGDFLDAIELDDGAVRIVVGDVCGHGADEAALGVALRVSWRALVLAGLPPGKVLGALERVLETERVAEETFATVCDIELDLARNLLHIRLAGHPSPLLIDGEDAAALPAPQRGPLLGVLEDARWPPHTVVLPERWTLVVFTDGIIEGRTGEDGRRLGTEGLLSLVAAALARSSDLGSLADLLVAGAERENRAPLQDDVALLLMSSSRSQAT
jgi:serine phosphatase RsbU (regulator of sigma subunit)